MKNLIASATKIVFIMIAFSLCLGFFLGKLTNEQFIGIATLVMSFYYARNNGNSGGTDISSSK